MASDAYHEIARDLRLLAATTKSPEARADLRLLAEEYDTHAVHLKVMAAPTEVAEHTKDKGDDPS